MVSSAFQDADSLRNPRAPPGTPSQTPRVASAAPQPEDMTWSEQSVFISEDPPGEALGKQQGERRRAALWAERLFRSARNLESSNLRLVVELERARVQEQLLRSK